MAASSSITHVPLKSLRTSEPSPYMFGNDDNESRNPAWSNKNWLRSIFHFSFAEVSYRDPRRNRCGVLRVMNDDLVQPLRGFGTHGHSDMEIATYVVDGELTHKDSMGTEESLPRGAVQFMTAGTGVRHSEFNRSATQPLRFIQMWIVPRKRMLKPNYGSACIDPAARAGGNWAHLVADVENADSSVTSPVRVNQDVNIFVTEAPEGGSAVFSVKPGRQAYMLLVEAGEVEVRGTGLAAPIVAAQHDALEVASATDVEFTAKARPMHLLVVEMAQDKAF